MKTTSLNLHGSLILAFSALTMGLTSMAQSQTIIQDTFSDVAGTNDVSWVGRTPSVTDLPGGTYIQADGGNYTPFVHWSGSWQSWPSGYGANPYGQAVGDLGSNGDGIAIPISSAGSYVKPTEFTISATLVTQATTSFSLALGFYSNVSAGSYQSTSWNAFTGLSLDNTGGLSLIVNGAQAGSTIAYSGGTYNPGDNNLYTISYEVNTATGGISNVVLQGSTANYSGFSSTAFTNAATAYAGLYQVSGIWQQINGDGTQPISEFSIAAVPEPSSVSLWVGGIGMLLLMRRRSTSFKA